MKKLAQGLAVLLTLVLLCSAGLADVSRIRLVIRDAENQETELPLGEGMTTRGARLFWLDLNQLPEEARALIAAGGGVVQVFNEYGEMMGEAPVSVVEGEKQFASKAMDLL